MMIAMKCDPFRTSKEKLHFIKIGLTGCVKVYDDSAGFFTSAHKLTEDELDRARKKWEAVREKKKR